MQQGGGDGFDPFSRYIVLRDEERSYSFSHEHGTTIEFHFSQRNGTSDM